MGTLLRTLDPEINPAPDPSRILEDRSEAWQIVRGGNHYAGQPRNSASARSVSLARLALAAAVRSRRAGLVGEAHRMTAYALNAHEQYAASVDHYELAIDALESAGEFHVAARTRLGLIAALFMSGQYGKAGETAGAADRWFRDNGDEDGRARLNANLGNLYNRLDQHTKAVEWFIFRFSGESTARPSPASGIFAGTSSRSEAKGTWLCATWTNPRRTCI